MNDQKWVEWIGIWGSGKTTCITGLLERLNESEIGYLPSSHFIHQTRRQKFRTLRKIPLRKLPSIVKILTILTPVFARAYLKKNMIVTSEVRSFVTCFIARMTSNIGPATNNILWEGEMHLLPILQLSNKKMAAVVNILLKLSDKRQNIIVVMKVDEDLAFNRVLTDKKNGTNVRFHEDQNFTLENLKAFASHQEQLIKILRQKKISIFESDGDLKNLKKFITVTKC